MISFYFILLQPKSEGQCKPLGRPSFLQVFWPNRVYYFRDANLRLALKK